jgi:hypothetical protein
MNIIPIIIQDLSTYSKTDLNTFITFYNLSHTTPEYKNLIEIALNIYISYYPLNSDMTIKFKKNSIDFDETKCFTNNYKIGSQLGLGSFGSVYSILPSNEGPPLVAKFQHLFNDATFNIFNKEINMLTTLGNLSISPKLIDSFICHDATILSGRVSYKYGDIGVIIMERWDGELNLKTLSETDIHEILDLLKKFHSYGFVHNDLKPDNIFYKLVNNTKIWALSDFGSSFNIQNITPELRRKVLSNWKWMESHYYNNLPTQKQEAFDLITEDVVYQHPNTIDAIFMYIIIRLFNTREVTEQYIRDMFIIGIDTDEDMDKTISFIDNE